jgi:AraC-like DNA-binding protein
MKSPHSDWPHLLLANTAGDFPNKFLTKGLLHHWILTWVRSGRGECTSDGYSYTLNAGELRLLPPQQPTIMTGLISPWQRIWCAFRDGSQPLELLQWGQRLGPVRLLSLPEGPDRDRIGFQMDSLLACHLAPGIHDRENLCLSLLRTVLLMARSLDHHRYRTADTVLLPALEEMRLHMDQQLTLGDLARLCKLSPSRFSHRFHQAMGISPMRYLEGLRLEQARHLLCHSQESIADIATRCGWLSHEHFSRVFKARCARSPRSFRNAALGIED